MQLTVKLFGQLAALAGHSEISIQGASDIISLRQVLENLLPNIKGITYVIAVDMHIINTNKRLSADSEIALLPPFSGG